MLDRTEGGGAEKAGGGAPPVFISYAAQDAAVADAVVGALERAGLKCWIAPRDVVPGALYADEIVRAINEAKVVVLVLSEAAAASPHVGKEIERASSKHRRILALRTDAASLPRAFEYFLSESQWIDVGSGGIEAAAAKLVDAVRRHLAPTSATEPNVPLAPHTLDRKLAAPRRRWVPLASAAVFAMALAYFVVDRVWVSKHLTAERHGLVAAAVVSDKSIAVLPFVDMSEKHDQEYFGDGMAEEILNLLVKVPQLKVIGRTSSFSFKGKQADLPSIGRALGAAYIVEGSIRRSSDRIRVTAQLIDARDGSHRWSDTFEGTTADTLRLQDEIAVRVAHSLNLEVAGQLPPRATIKPEAYDYYLRGLRELDENASDSVDKAREYFQKTLALAPQFAPAAVEIAETDMVTCADGIEPAVSCPRAHASVDAALKLDPHSADAYATRAQILMMFDWDWAGAAAAVSKAVNLGGGPRSMFAAAKLAYARGDMARARQLLQEIMTTNPFDPFAKIDMGYFVELRSGHFELAESWVRRGLQITPRYSGGLFMLGSTLLVQGKLDEALTSMRQERIDEGQLSGLSLVYSAMGRKADSDAALKAMERNGSYFPSDFARTYAFRGDLESALNYLQKAYETHDPFLWYIKGDPLFKNLEPDPRFKAFLRKMNLPE